MKKNYFLFLSIILLLTAKTSQAQGRFKVGAVAGINFSQIDGDNFSGYKKTGIGGGLRAGILLTEQFRLDFEMLYSQRGAFSEEFRSFRTTPHFFRVNLDYVEIPIIGTYRWKEFKKERKRKDKTTAYRFAIHTGVTIGRLINVDIEENQNLKLVPTQIAERLINFTEAEKNFVKNDLGIFIGFSTYFSQHIGIAIRHSVSLTPLYPPNKNENIGNKLINYYISTVGFYEF